MRFSFAGIVRQRLFFPVILLLFPAIVVLPGFLRADPVGPAANDRFITLSVVHLLKMKHLSQRELDDEISARFIETYLKMLDPGKMYFYQSDIDEFMKYKDKLDDLARRGDISFGYDVYKRFLQRVNERLQTADELLDAEHNFTVDEEIVRDREDADYPKTPEEVRELWRKRVKYDLLRMRVDKKKPLAGKEAVDKLKQRYSGRSRRMHQYSNDDLLEMYLTAMTSSYDPHTSYMSPSTLENFEIAMRLELEGIGASLQSDDDGTTVIKKIIPGGAADKCGQLHDEDRIVGVGQGEDGEIVDVVNMKLTDVVQLIRGKHGTVVRLQINPADESGEKTVTITRERIELKDSEARGEVIEEGAKPDGTPFRIGVIDLPSFYMDMEGARRGLPDFKSTARDVQRILNDFKSQGVDAVVLDLRRNGGGSLTEAINLTGLFIDRGPVVQVKGLGGYNLYEDPEPGVAWSGPLVVLISKFSASASEILAGAIQDYHRGLIVGDHSTHGKGTVQSLHDLNRELRILSPGAVKLGALKITMQQFYRPNGDSTQNRGVLADVELPSRTTYWDIGEADLDYPVAFDRLDATDFHKLNYVSKPLCRRLNKLSQTRRSDSEEWQKEVRKIEKDKQQKERKTITLNEAKFRALRDELLSSDDEQQKMAEELIDNDRPVIERDYYMNEALAVTLDFVRLTNGLPLDQRDGIAKTAPKNAK